METTIVIVTSGLELSLILPKEVSLFFNSIQSQIMLYKSVQNNIN